MNGHLAALLLTLILMGQKLAGETLTRPASVGDTVVLRCDVAHDKQTFWFGQRCDEAPFLSVLASLKSLQSDALFSQFLLGHSPRLLVEFDMAARSVLLKIENATEEDVALYYCASMQWGGLTFGNGTKIVMSGSGRDAPHPLPPPDCVLCCVHLTFISLVCAVVCTLSLCFCIRQMLKKKSKEQTTLASASG